MKSIRRQRICSVPFALSWSHCGALYRVTPWPDVRFERLYGDEWIEAPVDEDVLGAAAQQCRSQDWAPYLQFLPTSERDFIGTFSFCRMGALQVIARCPAIFSTLAEVPALTAFVAAHAKLRGTVSSWREINAVFERAGAFGLLEWLGLPASRQTLAVLRKFSDAEIPRRFLEPLRSMLWEPESLFVLQRIPVITDRELAVTCNALAA
jgi:hypothetical protein